MIRTRKHKPDGGRIVTLINSTCSGEDKETRFQRNRHQVSNECVRRPVRVVESMSEEERRLAVAASPLVTALFTWTRSSTYSVKDLIEWFFETFVGKFGAKLLRNDEETISAKLVSPSYDGHGDQCSKTVFQLYLSFGPNVDPNKVRMFRPRVPKLSIVATECCSQYLDPCFNLMRFDGDGPVPTGLKTISRMMLFRDASFEQWLCSPPPVEEDPPDAFATPLPSPSRPRSLFCGDRVLLRLHYVPKKPGFWYYGTVVDVDDEVATVLLRNGDIMKVHWQERFERDMLRHATVATDAHFAKSGDVRIQADLPFRYNVVYSPGSGAIL